MTETAIQYLFIMSRFRNVFNGLKRVLGMSNATFVGEDHLGNKYYENVIGKLSLLSFGATGSCL